MPAKSAQLPLHRAALAGAGLIFLTTAHAHASGRLPPVPIPPQAFHDFGACRAFLDDSYQQDVSKAEPNPVVIEGGSTRQTLIESEGPITLDPSHARYEVTEGWQVRHPAPEKGYAEISYSYRTTRMTCAGGALTGTYEQGYHSPSYENLPQSSPSH